MGRERDWDSNRIIGELDYGPIISTVVSLTWTDPTSLPLNDLRAAIRGVGSQANLVADLIVFGSPGD